MGAKGTRSRAIQRRRSEGEICCIQVTMNYPRDFSEVCAISSVVERLLHTQEVAGSNPASRTYLRKIRLPEQFWTLVG
jgi:hypothetical protein